MAEQEIYPFDPATQRVLIVDDDTGNANLLRATLESAGYEHIEIEMDSLHAEERFLDFQPDILVVDYHMPELNGVDVAAAILKHVPADQYLPILMVTGDDNPKVLDESLENGASDFLRLPFRRREVVLRIRNLLAGRQLHRRLSDRAGDLAAQVEERTRELEEARDDALTLLAFAAEYRDDQTGQHARRVGALSARIAEELGCAEEFVVRIRAAAPLHDVGKVAVPDGVLLKEGPITEEERRVIQEHVAIGAEILSRGRFPVLEMAATIARHHHERWDGKGYPDGLSGEEIPLPCRIVALADVFDALTHVRPYKEAWTVDDAMEEIETFDGRQFDPSCVRALRELVASGRHEIEDTSIAEIRSSPASD